MLVLVLTVPVAVFNSWFDHTIDQKERRHKVLRFLQHSELIEITNAFALWRQKLSRARSLRWLVKRKINSTLVAALNRWSVSVRSARRAQAAQEVRSLHATLEAYQQNMVGKMQAVGEGHSVRTCFFAWRDDAKREARNHRLLNVLLKKWLRGAAASSFVMWKEDAARQARTRTLLQRATARIRMVEIAAAWRRWGEQHRVLKLGKKVIRRMIRRRLDRIFREWWNHVRSNRRARTEARLKLAAAEVNAKQMAMHKGLEKHAEVQDRIASMFCRLRAAKELRLRCLLMFKYWQLQWLAGCNAHLQKRERDLVKETQDQASHSTDRLRRQIANLEDELSGVKKSLAEATNALHRKGTEEQTLRAQAKNAQSSAHQSVEAMEAARDLEAERARQLQDQLASQERATLAAKNAAEAQRVALNRASVVHKEELRVMQDEIEECA